MQKLESIKMKHNTIEDVIDTLKMMYSYVRPINEHMVIAGDSNTFSFLGDGISYLVDKNGNVTELRGRVILKRITGFDSGDIVFFDDNNRTIIVNERTGEKIVESKSPLSIWAMHDNYTVYVGEKRKDGKTELFALQYWTGKWVYLQDIIHYQLSDTQDGEFVWFVRDKDNNKGEPIKQYISSEDLGIYKYTGDM